MIENEKQQAETTKYDEATLETLESVTALEDSDVIDLFELHQIETVESPLVSETIYRQGDKLLVPASSRTVANKAMVRAENIFLSNQLMINNLCKSSVFSENDFIKVFSNYPFEDDYDHDKKEVLIRACALILSRLWDYIDRLDIDVNHEMKQVVIDNELSFKIPETIEDYDFDNIEILYAAKGGDFNLPLGVSVTYLGQSGGWLSKAVLALPSTKEMDNTYGVMPSAILTKKAYLFIKEIFDVNNKVTEKVVKRIMGEILDDLIEQFGSDYFFANIEHKEMTNDSQSNEC